MKSGYIKNPILPGFYPDPSICRVEDNFYMVCSSFELCPGIPVFHSKDLANWTQISNAMTKENGLHVNANVMAGGVMAPTIRYNEGLFYIINANFGDRGNYIIKTENPAGEWSKPTWLTEFPSIDASLFFDHDGQSYVVTPGDAIDNQGNKERGMFLVKFDINAMKRIGEPIQIWNSAFRHAASPESPHLYHIGEYYYLIIAEGGTEHYHAVTIARSKELFGWYESNPANPVMTHRHLGFSYPLVNVGHADLVDTQDGKWYAVMLGSRQIEGPHKNLGRETYICPVIWERDWPVFSPESGKIEMEYPAYKDTSVERRYKEDIFDDFDSKELALSWCFWGTPYQEFWKVKDSKLQLRCLKRPICRPLKQIVIGKPDMEKEDCVSLLGRRQTSVNFEAFCEIDFIADKEESAGFIIMQASNHQYRMERLCRNGHQILELILVTTTLSGFPHRPDFSSTSTEIILESIICNEQTVVLGCKAEGQKLELFYGKNMDNLNRMYKRVDLRMINPEYIGGMTGTMLGMFASGNGETTNNYAAFDWFHYKEV